MIPYFLITFTTSFATMSYSMLTASLVTDLSGEEVFSQCLTMGPYLMGLGLGSFFGDRIHKDKQLSVIWQLETISALILPLLPAIQLTLLFLFLHLSPFYVKLGGPESLKFLLTLGGTCAFVTGIIGGAQLPLIIKRAAPVGAEKILAVSYAGPLMAGPFIVVLTQLKFSVAEITTFVGFTQITGLMALISFFKERLWRIIFLALPLGVLVVQQNLYPLIEHLTIKSSYIGLKMRPFEIFELPRIVRMIKAYGELERIKTPYQTIDLFVEPPHEELGLGANATLFLNRKPQFDLSSIEVYHQSMVFGSLNILKRTPNKVLILGAGDGLLLKELRSLPVNDVTMVELDREILEFSKTHPLISSLNGYVLSFPDPRFHVIVDDAISFLRTQDKSSKFDLILIDFPFPNGHELAKLYSREFYTLVKRALAPDGVLAIDIPIQVTPEHELTHETKVILKTLEASGLSNRLLFGPYASFILVRGDGKKPVFDYDKFPQTLSLPARMNLVEIFDEVFLSPEEMESTEVNSMFRPGGL